MVDTKKGSLEGLMQQALAGDRRAYETALAETARLLRPFLARRIQNTSAREDIVQEILLSIHKARHTYDGMRPYMPWVFAIARYRLADHLRAHYSDRLHGSATLEEAEFISSPDVTESGFSYESIEKEVAGLPEKQARILRMMHQEGYTAKEVAEKTGMNESAVKVSAHRAYKLLRKKLLR
jgi:RNA polymerase sigma-70 factor (ECF subfamily)